MTVDSSSITSLYTTMFDAAQAKYAALWTSNQIDAETYAKLVGELAGTLVQSIPTIVQNQEQLDKDIEIKERDMVIREAASAKDIEIKERQMLEAEIMGLAQRVSMAKDDLIKDEQLIKVQEEIDLLQTQDLTAIYEKDNILPEQLTKIQEEIDLLQTQDLVAKEQRQATYVERVLKDKQAAKLGLDNAVCQSEDSRIADPNFVYTPKYETV